MALPAVTSRSGVLPTPGVADEDNKARPRLVEEQQQNVVGMAPYRVAQAGPTLVTPTPPDQTGVDAAQGRARQLVSTLGTTRRDAGADSPTYRAQLDQVYSAIARNPEQNLRNIITAGQHVGRTNPDAAAAVSDLLSMTAGADGRPDLRQPLQRVARELGIANPAEPWRTFNANIQPLTRLQQTAFDTMRGQLLANDKDGNPKRGAVLSAEQIQVLASNPEQAAIMLRGVLQQQRGGDAFNLPAAIAAAELLNHPDLRRPAGVGNDDPRATARYRTAFMLGRDPAALPEGGALPALTPTAQSYMRRITDRLSREAMEDIAAAHPATTTQVRAAVTGPAFNARVTQITDQLIADNRAVRDALDNRRATRELGTFRDGLEAGVRANLRQRALEGFMETSLGLTPRAANPHFMHIDDGEPNTARPRGYLFRFDANGRGTLAMPPLRVAHGSGVGNVIAPVLTAANYTTPYGTRGSAFSDAADTNLNPEGLFRANYTRGAVHTNDGMMINALGVSPGFNTNSERRGAYMHYIPSSQARTWGCMGIPQIERVQPLIAPLGDTPGFFFRWTPAPSFRNAQRQFWSVD